MTQFSRQNSKDMPAGYESDFSKGDGDIWKFCGHTEKKKGPPRRYRFDSSSTNYNCPKIIMKRCGLHLPIEYSRWEPRLKKKIALKLSTTGRDPAISHAQNSSTHLERKRKAPGKLFFVIGKARANDAPGTFCIGNTGGRARESGKPQHIPIIGAIFSQDADWTSS